MRRHPIDVFSLIAGLLFASLSISYIVSAYTTWRLDARLIVPLLLVGLGIGGLAAALVAQRRADKRYALAHAPALEQEEETADTLLDF